MITVFLLTLLLSSTAVKAEDSKLVRGAIPDGLAAPLLFSGDPKHMTGILPEYTEALAQAMNRKSTLMLLTRYRLNKYLEQGKADILCYTSRAWAEQKDDFDWSKTLFMKREVIVGPTPMPKHLSDLEDKTLGTMLNYLYPKLDAMFASKRVLREDASSEENNLNKLASNRLSYVVTDEIFLDYYKSRNPKIEEHRDRMFLQEYPISCSISRKGRVKARELNQAIDKLKANGKLEAIFKKYGVTIHY